MLNFSFKTISDSEAEMWKRRSQLRGLNTGRGTRRYIFQVHLRFLPCKTGVLRGATS